jgi:hydrogenase 3 maturation protease
MSTPSWQNWLRQKLASYPRPSIAILGIGNELRGDDAAGVIIARELHELSSGGSHAGIADRDVGVSLLPAAPTEMSAIPVWEPPLLIIEAGAAPEAFTGRLRRFDPDLVLMIDAAQMDQLPGTIRLIEWQDTIGLSASTHTLPLNVIAQYLVAELGCEVAVIGIQPDANTFDTPLSPAVQRAVEEVVHGVRQEAGGRLRYASATLITGTLFAPTLAKAASEFTRLTKIPLDVIPIVNERLGATITVAGLLMGEDVIAQLRDRVLGEIVILPRSMFDHPQGVALDDRSPLDIAQALQRPVALADAMGDVLDALTGRNRLSSSTMLD